MSKEELTWWGYNRVRWNWFVQFQPFTTWFSHIKIKALNEPRPMRGFIIIPMRQRINPSHWSSPWSDARYQPTKLYKYPIHYSFGGTFSRDSCHYSAGFSTRKLKYLEKFTKHIRTSLILWGWCISFSLICHLCVRAGCDRLFLLPILFSPAHPSRAINRYFSRITCSAILTRHAHDQVYYIRFEPTH